MAAKKKLVVLSGAGISAESGLQTFRDAGGLWEGYQVQEVATPGAWRKNPELVLRFYNERRRKVAEALPNSAHLLLASLEVHFDVTIITQNIDDLHERAGSSHVVHLHGEIFKKRSEHNENLISEVKGDIHPGDLAEDGFQYRPHIVWFGEEVPMMGKAILRTENADIFVVVGTSLVVYPAASLINYVPAGIPVYVIDRKIPDVPDSGNVIFIEKPATEGIALLQNLLIRKQQSHEI